MAFATRAVAAGRETVHRAVLVMAAAVLVQCGGAQPEPQPTPASLFDPNAETSRPARSRDTQTITTLERPAEPTTVPESGPSATEPTAPSESDAARTTPTTPSGTKAKALSEAQIAAVLDLANERQVELARGAQGKSGDAKVKNFAGTLIANHNQLRLKRAELKLGSAESQLSSEMGLDWGRTRALLRSGGDETFDKAFIAAEIDIHRKFLTAIDEQLLPNAHTPELRALLRDVRSRAERQLKLAEEVQAELVP